MHSIDQDVHEGWSVFLRYQGYDVSSAEDGPTGLELIETEAPDVALLDLGLPGMHGLEILHEIRMSGLATKVIVVSATANPETERRARAHGAGAVLHKPVSMYKIMSLIDDLSRGLRPARGADRR